MNSIWTIVPSIGILWVLDLEFRFLFLIFNLYFCVFESSDSMVSCLFLPQCDRSFALFSESSWLCVQYLFLGHFLFPLKVCFLACILTVSPSFVIVSLALLVFTCVFLFVKLCFHVLSRAALFTFGSWCLSFWIPVCSCVFGSVVHLSCFVCIGLVCICCL